MRFEEYQINQWLENISLEEQSQIKSAFSKHYNVIVGLTPGELASLNMEVLIPLRDTIQGIVMTKANKPNIIDAYHASRSKKLPRKTEFGVVRDSDE